MNEKLDKSLKKIGLMGRMDDYVIDIERSTLIYYKNEEAEYMVVPDGISVIDDYCFSQMNKLKGVRLPDTLEYIGTGAFDSCTRLEKIEIPDSVKEIGSGVFSKCMSLTEVKLPSRLYELPDWTFYCCDSLEKVEMTDSVEFIGSACFHSCSNLLELNLSKNITELKEYCFYCCGIESINLESIRTIGFKCFSESDIRTIKIPDTATTVDTRGLFEGCRRLKKAYIGDGVKELDNRTFFKCNALRELNVGKDCMIGVTCLDYENNVNIIRRS